MLFCDPPTWLCFGIFFQGWYYLAAVSEKPPNVAEPQFSHLLTGGKKQKKTRQFTSLVHIGIQLNKGIDVFLV